EITSAPSRARRTPATAVLPDAVAPKRARTCLETGAGRLLVAMVELGSRARPLERPVLFRMRGAPLTEPGHGLRDSVGERCLRLPAEQPARLADVGDVVRDLAEKRRGHRDARIDLELRGDQLGGAHERIALPVGEVDRLVRDAAFDERVHAAGDP